MRRIVRVPRNIIMVVSKGHRNTSLVFAGLAGLAGRLGPGIPGE